MYAPHRPLDPIVADAAFDLLGLTADDAFVDFGCGDGALLVRVAPLVRAVVGVELDPRLVVRARAAVSAPGLAGRIRVLHEPIGWSVPSGMTAGLSHLLSWGTVQVLAWLARAAPPGFRLAAVDEGTVGLPPSSAEVRVSLPGGGRRRVALFVFG